MCGDGPVFHQADEPASDTPLGRTKRHRWLTLVVIVLVVTGLVTSGSLVAVRTIRGGVANLDSYGLGPDTVPSVKQVLGGERKMLSHSVTDLPETSEWVIRYQPVADHMDEWSGYISYLVDKEQFEIVQSDNLTATTGVVGLAKPSATDGFYLYLQIWWDESGYTMTILRTRQPVI